MSTENKPDVNQLLDSLSPAVPDSLADVVAAKLKDGKTLSLRPKQDVAGSKLMVKYGNIY
ncbi:MAG: hypothetical protein NTX46_02925 [Chloroflexi bacterium]|nr:hypothetical protein [Chloroflexota bacterium]